MIRLLNVHSRESDYHKADPQPLWDGTEWPTGWHNIYHPIDHAQFADLLEKPLDQVVSNVWAQIAKHVELLEKFYLETASGLIHTTSSL
jgi:hypothetical protein